VIVNFSDMQPVSGSPRRSVKYAGWLKYPKDYTCWSRIIGVGNNHAAALQTDGTVAAGHILPGHWAHGRDVSAELEII